MGIQGLTKHASSPLRKPRHALKDDGRKQKLKSSSTYSKVESVQGAAVVARRGLLSPGCLKDRSGENVLRKGTESAYPALRWQVSKETHQHQTRRPTQVHSPQSCLSSSGSPTPKAPFLLTPSQGALRAPSVPPSACSLLPVSGFRSQMQVIPSRRCLPRPPPHPRLRSTPAGASPRRSSFPASGPLLRRALRLRFPLSASGQPWLGASGPPLWYLPEQVSLPRFGTSLRPPAHCPRAPSPQALSLRLRSPSPGPSALYPGYLGSGPVVGDL